MLPRGAPYKSRKYIWPELHNVGCPGAVCWQNLSVRRYMAPRYWRVSAPVLDHGSEIEIAVGR